MSKAKLAKKTLEAAKKAVSGKKAAELAAKADDAAKAAKSFSLPDDLAKEGYTAIIDEHEVSPNEWIPAVIIKKDDKRVGHFAYEPMGKGEIYPRNAEVAPDHRRKGLATAMYDLVESQTGRKVVPSNVQSDDAAKFWQSRQAKAKTHSVPPSIARDPRVEAQKVLERIKTPEQAVALKGAEREEYLKALDAAYGPQSKRAADMGFSNEELYHGSFRDIKQFKPEKGSPEGFMGKSTYLTNDPADASWNYADKEGPDHVGKLEQLIERLQGEKDLNYTAAKELAEKKLFGRVDQGAVYPVRVRTETTADMRPGASQYIDLNNEYDDAGDSVKENPTAIKIAEGIRERAAAAESRLQADNIIESAELYDEKQPADLFHSVRNATLDREISDRSGNYLGSEFGRGALEDAGFDSARINAYNEFSMPNMTEDAEHLMVFDPAKIRSKFAAFDPRFKDSPLLMAGAAGAAVGLGATGAQEAEASPASAAKKIAKSVAAADKAMDASKAKKILERVKTAEEAVALKGAEREEYLAALDTLHGPAEKRAADMLSSNSNLLDKDALFAKEKALNTQPGHGAAVDKILRRGSLYRREKVPLDSLQRYHETPDKPMFLEGADDEKYAQEFAKLPRETAPPITIEKADIPEDYRSAGRENQILSGRHRARAAYLRGDKDIEADTLHRLPEAAFDPRFKDSPLLMAGAAGATVAGVGTALTPEQSEASPLSPTFAKLRANRLAKKAAEIAEKQSAPAIAKAGLSSDEATKILEKVSSPEQAVKLKGAERQQYLQALDVVYGPRQKRATDMGFSNKRLYHGSPNKPFESFDADKAGSSSNHQSADLGAWLTPDADVAENYTYRNGKKTKNGHVRELRERFDNPEDIDFSQLEPSETEYLPTEDLERYLDRKPEVDALTIRNSPGETLNTDPDGASDVTLVRSPEKLRDVSANFDPRFADSPLLMSAVGKKPTAADVLARMNKPFGKVVDAAGDALNAYDEHVASPIGAAAADAATDLANLTKLPGTSPAVHNRVLEDVGAAASLAGELGLDPLNALPGGATVRKAVQGARSGQALKVLEKLKQLRSINLEKPLAASMIKATPASSAAKAVEPLRAADDAARAAQKAKQAITHDPVDAQKFYDSLNTARGGDARVAEYTHLYTPEEYANMKVFLAPDGRSGFAVKPDGDIVSAFNAERGGGRLQSIMDTAKAHGGRKLDAFDKKAGEAKGLPDLYSKHGFKEVKREANWTAGGPDVVYMELDNAAKQPVLQIVPPVPQPAPMPQPATPVEIGPRISNASESPVKVITQTPALDSALRKLKSGEVAIPASRASEVQAVLDRLQKPAK